MGRRCPRGLPAAMLAAVIGLAGCASAVQPAKTPGVEPARAAAPAEAPRETPPVTPRETPPVTPREESWNPDTVSGDGFVVGPDARVFALFALLHGVTGGDRDAGPPRDPLLLALQSDLDTALARAGAARVGRWKESAEAHRLAVDRYLPCVLSLGLPPTFGPPRTAAPGCDGDLEGFHRVLAEFWKETGLEKLYLGRYREDLVRLAARYDRRTLQADLSLVQGYLHLSAREAARVKIRIVPNPFDSRGSSYSAAIGNLLVCIDAPDDRPARIDALGYARLVVQPAVAASAGLRSEAVQGIVRAGRGRPLVKGVHEEPAQFVSECLARAAAYRIEQARSAGRDPGILDSLWKKARQDSEGGLTLVPWFFAELSRFEADDSLGLGEFVDSALARLEK